MLGFIIIIMNYILSTLLLGFLSCKAQQPVISLQNGDLFPRIQNAYYKDTSNDFNKFIGTWKYTNGNEVFVIAFKKISQRAVNVNVPTPIPFYEDILIDEYKYIDSNDVLTIDTLNNINNSALNIFDHLIYGNDYVAKYYPPVCEACENDEKRVILDFEDPGRAYFNYKIIIRRVLSPFFDTNGNSIETIELQLTNEMSNIPLGESAESRIPYRKYTLIKQ